MVLIINLSTWFVSHKFYTIYRGGGQGLVHVVVTFFLAFLYNHTTVCEKIDNKVTNYTMSGLFPKSDMKRRSCGQWPSHKSISITFLAGNNNNKKVIIYTMDNHRTNLSWWVNHGIYSLNDAFSAVKSAPIECFSR